MPPAKENRGFIALRIPQDWIDALGNEAKIAGKSRLAYIRQLIDEGMTSRAIPHSKDDYGVFVKRWRVTRSELQDRVRKRRNEHVRRYRAKLKAKKQQAIADAANSITWTFHPSGQITTSDLDVLATFVGHVDERGRFTPENTRHSVQSARAKALEALNAGSLTGERWHLFVRDVQG